MKLTLATLKNVYRSKQIDAHTMERKGYELITELFVDSSGWGQPDELALTGNQFERELTNLLTEHGELYATLTGVGQFQVYVGLFKRTGKPAMKRVGNNTYIMPTATGFVVQLHNTDILTLDGRTVTLNCGGWHTMTTGKRMSLYLPDTYYVGLYQHALRLVRLDGDDHGTTYHYTYFTGDTLTFTVTAAQARAMRKRVGL